MPPAAGRRGRKPRGGKIVAASSSAARVSPVPQSIVLRFSCSLSEARGTTSTRTPEPECAQVRDQPEADSGDTVFASSVQVSTRASAPVARARPEQLWDKVRRLNDSLHHASGFGKSSACFWCTCSFATPPVYVPSDVRGEVVHVYGSFCSPECAAAYLFREDIDEAQRWERYALLNLVYGGLFGHKRNVKPAPSPFYLLDKFYGSLTVEEYRQLLASNKRLIVVDRPLARSVPHLFDDNDEMSGPRIAQPTKRAIVQSAFSAVGGKSAL